MAPTRKIPRIFVRLTFGRNPGQATQQEKSPRELSAFRTCGVKSNGSPATPITIAFDIHQPAGPPQRVTFVEPLRKLVNSPTNHPVSLESTEALSSVSPPRPEQSRLGRLWTAKRPTALLSRTDDVGMILFADRPRTCLLFI
jgi:hypothetical protein